MAEHVRKQIRDASRELLRGLSLTGDNVFSSRVRNLQEDELPAIDVDTQLGGEIRAGSIGGASRILERALTLSVAVTVSKSDGYQDAMDAIFLDIEQALASDNTLGQLCKYIQPTTEPAVDLEGDGARPVVRGEMQFEVFYATALNAPDIPM